MRLALLRRLDRVLVPSRYMHEQLLLNGLQAAGKDAAVLACQPRAAEQTDKDAARRFCLAASTKARGSACSCIAWHSCRHWHGGPRSRVAGPFLAEAKAIAKQQGLIERVELLGQAAHVRPRAFV